MLLKWSAARTRSADRGEKCTDTYMVNAVGIISDDATRLRFLVGPTTRSIRAPRGAASTAPTGCMSTTPREPGTRLFESGIQRRPWHLRRSDLGRRSVACGSSRRVREPLQTQARDRQAFEVSTQKRPRQHRLPARVNAVALSLEMEECAGRQAEFFVYVRSFGRARLLPLPHPMPSRWTGSAKGCAGRIRAGTACLG